MNSQRTSQATAVFVLALIALITVAATGYAAIVKNSEVAQTLLGTLATGSMGALIVLAGGKKE